MYLNNLLEKLHCKKIRIVDVGIRAKDRKEIKTIIEGTDYIDICGYLHRFVSKVEVVIDDDCITPLTIIYI